LDQNHEKKVRTQNLPISILVFYFTSSSLKLKQNKKVKEQERNHIDRPNKTYFVHVWVHVSQINWLTQRSKSYPYPSLDDCTLWTIVYNLPKTRPFYSSVILSFCSLLDKYYFPIQEKKKDSFHGFFKASSFFESSSWTQNRWVT
jgi:hypothetical protein